VAVRDDSLVSSLAGETVPTRRGGGPVPAGQHGLGVFADRSHYIAELRICGRIVTLGTSFRTSELAARWALWMVYFDNSVNFDVFYGYQGS
jgi:hypothetical protein